MRTAFPHNHLIMFAEVSLMGRRHSDSMDGSVISTCEGELGGWEINRMH